MLKPLGHFKHVVSDHYNKCGHFLSVVAIFCGVWTFFVEYGHFLSGVVSGHYNKCGHFVGCGNFLWSVDIFCCVWTFLVECGHFLSGVVTTSVDIFVECGHFLLCVDIS